MSARTETWLWLTHRLTGLILAVLVTVHIVTIIVAIQGELTAAEILSRTRGSLVWAGVYGLFVMAASVHGAIGLRAVVREMTPWRDRSLDGAALIFALLLLVLGLRAVAGVILG